MNKALTALYALQQVDSALALAQRQYQALDLGRAEQAAAESARARLDEASRLYHETHRDLQDAELELKTVEAKKKDHEGKLYGGKITVPKEMTAMQEEIEALGRQRGRLDERILTLMEQLEARRAELETAKTTLAAAESALAAKQAAFKAAARKLSVQARALAPRREEMAKEILPALLKRYEAIRAAKHGVGIGRIEEGRCGACHTNLPRNLMQKVQETEEVVTCENCGRLLCAEGS